MPETIFDQALHAVRRHSKARSGAYIELVERAKLFYIGRETQEEYYPEQTDGKLRIKGSLEADFFRLLVDNFFLPFEQTGMLFNRNKIFAAFGDNGPKVRGPNAEREITIASEAKGIVTVFTGLLRKIERTDDLSLEVSFVLIERIRIAPEGVIVQNAEQAPWSASGAGFNDLVGGMLIDGLRYVALTNLPNHFVVEESTTPNYLRKARLLPNEKRPRYTVLTPGQILKRLKKEPKPALDETGKRVVEFRRAHERLLSDDRYVNLKGTRVHVRAVWNHEVEWDDEEEHKKYRILLDL